ncbi:hypothetical protein [Nocardia sp. NPDC049707]|uniref:hypothetical protein n=1 Tax=Nocardia sp. NPDC049707 TaxID=3154735 RepID=UPI00342238C1
MQGNNIQSLLRSTMSTLRIVDALELLELESQTIWGWTDGGLADNTIAATAISVDGRSVAIPGATRLIPTGTITALISRCWQLDDVRP